MADTTPVQLQWRSNAGGVREGAGRPQKPTITSRAEREIRIAIPRDLHNRWTNYKRIRGCRNDGEFAKYLLDLAEKEL